MERVRKITFSDMRAMVEQGRGEQSGLFFMSGDFGIGMGINEVFRSIMSTDVPFAISDNRFGMLRRGELDVTVNLMNVCVRPGMAVCIRSGSIVQVNRVSADIDMCGMIMCDDFFRLALHGHVPAAFAGGALHAWAHMTDGEEGVIADILRAAWGVVHQKRHTVEAVYGLAAALVHFYDGLMRRAETGADTTGDRCRETFERFIALVNAHCANERRLAWYAGKLCLSERYLGTVVRQASGTTAKEWIDRAVATAAKVMLRHTDMTVSQIAYRLNFATDSFFCKYFRRTTGQTPLEYRRGE